MDRRVCLNNCSLFFSLFTFLGDNFEAPSNAAKVGPKLIKSQDILSRRLGKHQQVSGYIEYCLLLFSLFSLSPKCHDQKVALFFNFCLFFFFFFFLVNTSTVYSSCLLTPTECNNYNSQVHTDKEKEGTFGLIFIGAKMKRYRHGHGSG